MVSHHGNGTTTKTIELSIKSLEKGISKLFAKRQQPAVDQRIQASVHFLVKHIHHLLEELLIKRESLRSLIQWFGNEWNARLAPALLLSSSSTTTTTTTKSEQQQKNVLAILQHTLEVFVRCQDGLVLLTSGECRHAGDIQCAKKTKYTSKLSTLKERQDGYTCLYKSDAIYSGFGWDEYANETVGIHTRLVSLLRKGSRHKSPWEWLENQSHTQLLDTLLDEQERAVKDMQQELQKLKQKVMQDIKHGLSTTKLTFLTQDKMERLTVSYGQHAIRLERRADTFQLEGSVLPNDRQSPRDWDCYAIKLQTPTNTNANNDDTGNNNNNKNKAAKRRRLTIEDSDDEDHTTVPKTGGTQQAASGLLVKVQNVKQKEEQEHSVATIKNQMGIDAFRLEAARETLEEESKQRKKQEDNVDRLKKVLIRVQNRDFVDENEIWDARECLRQAYMEMGNDYLWTTKDFAKALECFQNAKELVVEQQRVHNISTRNANDDTPESNLIQRNLLFLLARASVNIGIVLVEWSSLEKSRKTLTKALAEFRAVRDVTKELRNKALLDRNACAEEYSSDWMEAMSDFVKANQVESLACRWMGIAMWSSNLQDQAIDVLLHASSLCEITSAVTRDDQLLQDVLENVVECTYATCTLADLACSAMERLIRSDTSKGDLLLSTIKQALQRHIELSLELEKLAADSTSPMVGNTVRSFLQEEQVVSSKEVRDQLEEISNWWNIVKQQPAGFGRNNNYTNQSLQLPRSDLFSLGIFTGNKKSANNSKEPIVRILASEIPRLRRQQRKQRNGGSSSSSSSYKRMAQYQRTQTRNPASNSFLEDCSGSNDDSTYHRPEKFRKWGDELLQSKTLVYPSVAPEMPPHIQEYLQQYKNQASAMSAT